MRVILYSGKGGVGKTTLSAATAVRSARLGHRTLVISTDAAHSLADALVRPIGPDPTTIEDRLDAVEIDVNEELARRWGTIHEWLAKFMAFRGIEDVVAEEMAILPGMEELFSLLQVSTFAKSGRYDVIVVDCAPTGETIRLLGVPDILNFYFARIFPIQRTVVRSVRPVAQKMTDLPIPTDDVFAAVQALYERLRGMGPLLQNPGTSSIRIVLNPEGMVIKESQRLYTYLSLFGFPVDAVVANRVLPVEARSAYFDRWFEIQKGYLEGARQAFEPLPLFEARLFEREMVGLTLLDEMAQAVFGPKDPTQIFFRGRPIEVRKEGSAHVMVIDLPFAEKEKVQVVTRGDDLVVQVDNQRRVLALPRSLSGRRVAGAAFVDGKLRVKFSGKKEA